MTVWQYQDQNQHVQYQDPAKWNSVKLLFIIDAFPIVTYQNVFTEKHSIVES